MRRDLVEDGGWDVVLRAVDHQVIQGRDEAGPAVLRQKIVTKRGDDEAGIPFRSAGKGIEASGGFFDFADALPGLLTGQAGQLPERTLVCRDVEEVLAEDAEQPIL